MQLVAWLLDWINVAVSASPGEILEFTAKLVGAALLAATLIEDKPQESDDGSGERGS